MATPEEQYHGNGLYDMPYFDRLADARHAWLCYEPEIRDWVYWRVRAWWQSEPRQPAVTAFTSGVERAVATLIEEATAELEPLKRHVETIGPEHANRELFEVCSVAGFGRGDRWLSENAVDLIRHLQARVAVLDAQK